MYVPHKSQHACENPKRTVVASSSLCLATVVASAACAPAARAASLAAATSAIARCPCSCSVAMAVSWAETCDRRCVLSCSCWTRAASSSLTRFSKLWCGCGA